MSARRAHSAPLLIRADADPRIGSGHVMRCLALAQAWRGLGGEAVLIGRCPNPSLRGRVRRAGVALELLPRSWPDKSDPARVLRRLCGPRREGAGPWVVVDGYRFDAAYRRALRSGGCRLLCMEDPPYRMDEDCDAVLAPYARARPGRRAPGPLRLHGPRYALLRPEFSRRPSRPPRRSGPVRLLVTMGGSDPAGATGWILRSLGGLPAGDLEVTAVLGADNPREARLRRAFRDAPFRLRWLRDVRDMQRLMLRADMAVSAAGVTSLELAACGTPAVLVAAADNQRAGARLLSSAGAAVCAGDFGRVGSETLSRLVASLAGSPERRRRMSRAGRALVDGRGALRVARLLASRPVGRAGRGGA